MINLAKNILAAIYPQSTAQTAALGTAAIVGAVIGQLFFGGLADVIGRRTIFIITLTLGIVASLGSATCVDSPSFSIYTQLCLWRGLLGFGIGGEYPLSATVTVEKSEEGGSSAAAHSLLSRGRAIAVVFSMQGLGNLSACLVCVVLLAAKVPLDITWRASLAAGALPGLLTVFWRCRMAETAHFSAASKAAASGEGKAALLSVGDSSDDGFGDEGRTAAAVAAPGVTTIFRHIYDNRYALIGAAGSWCIFDIVFYGNGLFTATIISTLGFDTGKAGSQTEGQLLQLAVGSLIIAAIGLPGYYVAVALIDRMGRRRMQLMGFAMITVLFAVLASTLAEIKQLPALFIFVYGLTFFFANFGPNMTTFIVPAEAFPTAARATCHGISAASGKIGAAVGAAAMAPLLTAYGTSDSEKNQGLVVVLAICAALGALGTVWTWVFTKETRDISLSATAVRVDEKLAGAATVPILSK